MQRYFTKLIQIFTITFATLLFAGILPSRSFAGVDYCNGVSSCVNSKSFSDCMATLKPGQTCFPNGDPSYPYHSTYCKPGYYGVQGVGCLEDKNPTCPAGQVLNTYNVNGGQKVCGAPIASGSNNNTSSAPIVLPGCLPGQTYNGQGICTFGSQPSTACDSNPGTSLQCTGNKEDGNRTCRCCPYGTTLSPNAVFTAYGSDLGTVCGAGNVRLGSTFYAYSADGNSIIYKNTCQGMACGNTNPTWVQSSSTPRPRPSTTTINSACRQISIFDESWNAYTSSTLSNIKPGSKINLCVFSGPSASRARFTINGVVAPITATRRPLFNTTNFCGLYTVPADTYSLNIKGEVYALGKWQ